MVGPLLLIAILIGGGGSNYGLLNLCVQLAALLVLAFHREGLVQFWQEAPWFVRLLIAASCALPILQLIPLPPQVWHNLPGREFAIEARQIAGVDGWAPFTLDRNRTIGAALSLIVPMAVLAAGWRLSPEALIRLGWMIVALGIFNLLLGAVQVVSQGTTAILYPELPMPGVLFGTFANRNTTGIFLVTCLTLAALLPPLGQSSAMRIMHWSGIALMVFAIALTRSRSAIALSLLPLAAMAGRYILEKRPDAKKLIAALAAAAALGTAIVAIAPDTRLGATIDRFDTDSDPRSFIWDDAAYSAGRYWPVGAGTGTFDEVFQADRALENFGHRKAGRAHNEYLEVAIENGLPGIALAWGWILSILGLAFTARNSRIRWIAWSGAMIAGCAALQGITDYPFRNIAMLSVYAFALLLLLLPTRLVEEDAA
jgi:O-antigen ligase